MRFIEMILSHHLRALDLHLFTGLSLAPVFTLPIASTTSMPSTTLPKTGCLLSRKLLFTRLMKNWLPPVLGPALAMLMVPRSFRSCG